MSTPAVQRYDARVGYEFLRALWRGHGRGLRVNLGVENLADKEPPFIDVIYAYNTALHSDLVRGRTIELSFVLPY